jgi:hypothetical protein
LEESAQSDEDHQLDGDDQCVTANEGKLPPDLLHQSIKHALKLKELLRWISPSSFGISDLWFKRIFTRRPQKDVKFIR